VGNHEPQNANARAQEFGNTAHFIPSFIID
jgi:hypothetical protein